MMRARKEYRQSVLLLLVFLLAEFSLFASTAEGARVSLKAHHARRTSAVPTPSMQDFLSASLSGDLTGVKKELGLSSKAVSSLLSSSNPLSSDPLGSSVPYPKTSTSETNGFSAPPPHPTASGVHSSLPSSSSHSSHSSLSSLSHSLSSSSASSHHPFSSSSHDPFSSHSLHSSYSSLSSPSVSSASFSSQSLDGSSGSSSHASPRESHSVDGSYMPNFPEPPPRCVESCLGSPITKIVPSFAVLNAVENRESHRQRALELDHDLGGPTFADEMHDTAATVARAKLIRKVSKDAAKEAEERIARLAQKVHHLTCKAKVEAVRALHTFDEYVYFKSIMGKKQLVQFDPTQHC